ARHTTFTQTGNSTIIFAVDLLADVLMHLDGDTEPLKRTLSTIWDEKKRVMGMRHWHNIGLLSGRIDKEAYMAQPNQPRIQSDYLFYAAVHEDLYGDKQKALRLYQARMDLPRYQLSTSMTRDRFVAYRMKQLK
ncbi:MAG: hypothetical protein HRU15_08595, partial [Planctomycetes bacterium]|nr:hypothetical protein [Planctomycetota bacterium]